MNETLSDRQERLLLELFERESRRVHSVGLRITRDPDLSADAFQETFLRLARWIKTQTESLPQADSLQGLVQVIAERAATDVLRRHIRIVRRETHPSEATGYSSQAQDLNAVIDSERLLRFLTAKERTLLDLAYQHGYSAEEIGLRLRMSPAAIRIMKHRILRRLREITQNATVPHALPEIKHDRM